MLVPNWHFCIRLSYMYRNIQICHINNRPLLEKFIVTLFISVSNQKVRYLPLNNKFLQKNPFFSLKKTKQFSTRIFGIFTRIKKLLIVILILIGFEQNSHRILKSSCLNKLLQERLWILNITYRKVFLLWELLFSYWIFFKG